MNRLLIFVLATLAVGDVYGRQSLYHGPSVIPHVLHNGYLADTHEVAAAKSAHLAALATQSHSHGYEGSHGYSGGEEHSSSHGDLRYHGPTAIPQVLHDGHIEDTHEVAAAKADHLAAVAKAKSHVEYGYENNGRYAEENVKNSGAYHGYSQHITPYHGPLAKPVVLKSGYLADTHEVAAAKHHHLAALLSQSHARGFGEGFVYGKNDEYSQSRSLKNNGVHGDSRYHGPTAIPHVLHDGHIADTHEVATAKAEHLAAVTKAKVHAAYNHDYNGQSAGGYGEHSRVNQGLSHHVAPYH